MLRRDDIYETIATPYEVLISKEDFEGNIPASLSDLADFGGKDVIDLGAGTGRLTCMAAPLAKSILAVDFAAGMLQVTAQKLTRMGLSNWRTAVADYRQVPAPDQSADIVMAGWTIGYAASTNHAEWEDNLRQVVAEIERLLRPGGIAIILETLGTAMRSRPRLIFSSRTTRRSKNGTDSGIGGSERITGSIPLSRPSNCAGISSETRLRIGSGTRIRASSPNVRESGGATKRRILPDREISVCIGSLFALEANLPANAELVRYHSKA